MGLSGIIVLALAERLDPREIWLWLALLCLPLAAASWRWVGGAARPSQAHDGARSRDSASKSTPFLPWLVAAYFCEGLGYIVSGTFLSAIVQANLASNTAGAATWIVAGLAAAASTIFWPGWAARWGEVRALVAAYALQALGILLPALSPDVTAAYVGAALFGGTFMGIAALVMGLGQQLAPQQSARVLGLLTAAFGIGQIIGPMLAGLVAERTASFTLPLMGAAAVVTAGGVLLMIGARRRIIYRANVVTEHAMK
jgi:predicted MFS family arabinose efflux permease